MSTLNTGQIAALDIALDPISHSAANRVGILGDMVMQPDNSTCHGGKLVYNQNLCYIEVDWGQARRQARGSRYLYFPRVVVIYYASGYIFANDVTLLQGAGDAFGAILFPGLSTGLTTMYAVGGDGPPIGSPVFGDFVNVLETYDP